MIPFICRARKEALGCQIEDAPEVMPVCVVEDVRKRPEEAMAKS